MANRHLARSVALQTLYEWDFKGKSAAEVDEIAEQTTSEFAPELKGEPFVRRLVRGVASSREKLDRVIEKAAPDWPIEQITIVDRNILRLGLWELLFGDRNEVPPKVAINEAIELAKTFGSHSAGKFVNGVLGTIYKELVETPLADQETEQLAGAVVFRKTAQGVFLAMVKDVFGYWTFVKGHIEPKETPAEAALREVKEEIGIVGVPAGSLGEITYAAKEKERKVQRRVAYFLVQSADEQLKLEASAGLTETRWVALEEVKKLHHYQNQDEIIEKATTYIKSLISKP